MILKLLSQLYGFAVTRRNKRFDVGRGVRYVGVPVISVGNLSVGGTGKTPFVAMVVRGLLDLGYSPAVVSRGYRRRSKGMIVVSDGSGNISDVQRSGDELQLLARLLSNIPVVASVDRYEGAYYAVQNFKVDCIVLDDAFQHRQVARDVDIVLVDNDTLFGKLLPSGRLREPLNSLSRANIVGIRPEINEETLTRFYSGKFYVYDTSVSGYMSLSLTDTLPKPEQAIAVAAIANPERFTASLTGEGIRIEHKMYFSDHHFYSNTDVNMIIKECHARNASVIITTQKDAVKLVEFTDTFAAQKITVVVSCIRTNLSSSDDFFRALEQLINNGSKKNQI